MKEGGREHKRTEGGREGERERKDEGGRWMRGEEMEERRGGNDRGYLRGMNMGGKGGSRWEEGEMRGEGVLSRQRNATFPVRGSHSWEDKEGEGEEEEGRAKVRRGRGGGEREGEVEKTPRKENTIINVLINLHTVYIYIPLKSHKHNISIKLLSI